MSDTEPSIYGLVFSATSKDKARLETAFPNMKFVSDTSPLRMSPSVIAMQQQYQTSYTNRINQIPKKPDFLLYKQLQKVAAEFYNIKLGK